MALVEPNHPEPVAIETAKKRQHRFGGHDAAVVETASSGTFPRRKECFQCEFESNVKDQYGKQPGNQEKKESYDRAVVRRGEEAGIALASSLDHE